MSSLYLCLVILVQSTLNSGIFFHDKFAQKSCNFSLSINRLIDYPATKYNTPDEGEEHLCQCFTALHDCSKQ